jgi:hypothetical protein
MRSAVSYGEAAETERVLKALTIERLSREPSLFVLERQRMELLSEEKARQGMDDRPFWNGSYLLDGTIDRDGYNPERMTLDVKLTPALGGPAVDLGGTGSRTNLAGLVEKMVGKVTAALKIKASGEAWNAADEAEQYFKEAQWAYRWGATKEAQNAAESAVALGKRSKELALLRIRAYAGDLPFDGETAGDIYAPSFPDSEQIPIITRGLELYCQDVSLVLTNANTNNFDSFVLGARLFKQTAELLDGFYYNAGMREHHEAELAEMRRLARQLCLILETNRLSLPREVFYEPWPRGRWTSLQFSYHAIREELENHDRVKWLMGGLIFDRPEDSLPFFQELLVDGYCPTQPAGMAGWSWEERKRIPAVRRQLLERLNASTNVALRVGGLCLGWINVGYQPETEFLGKEQQLLDTLWDDRDWVFSRPDHAGVLEQVRTILDDQRAEGDAEQLLRNLRQKLWRAYLLANETNLNPLALDTLWPDWAKTISTNEAQELVLTLEGDTNRSPQLTNVVKQLRLRAAMPVVPEKPAEVKFLPAEKPLSVDFTEWNGLVLDSNPKLPPRIHQAIWREGRLWVEINYPKPNYPWESAAPPRFVSVDVETGRATGVYFPGEAFEASKGFEVTADSLYFGAKDQIERYRFADRKWTAIKVPAFRGSAITEFNGKLYVSSQEDLLKVDPDSGAVEILASSRRQPQVTELDELLQHWGHGFFKSDQRLGIYAGGQLYMVSKSNQVPQKVMAGGVLGGNLFFPSEAGVVVGSFGMLWGCWFDQSKPERLLWSSLLRSKTNGPAGIRNQPPRWDWPPFLRLVPENLFIEGKNVWALARCSNSLWFHNNDTAVTFQDPRQATLLHFGADSRQAMEVPILFRKDHQPHDPFEDADLLSHNGMGTGDFPVFSVRTPAGFVVGCRDLMGHWLIRRSEVQNRLAPIPPLELNAGLGKTNASPLKGTVP